MVLLFRYNRFQGSVWFTEANAVVGKVDSWKAKAESYLELSEINDNLTRENVQLQLANEALRRQLTELTHDSTYAERVQAELIAPTNPIPAHVVSNSIRRKDNRIVLDRGALDGVKPEMGVVSGTGVVGIVAQVSEHYCVVMPVLNSHSSISCRLRGTEYFGYLKWNGEGPMDAAIDDIPRHAVFELGDVVETSGYSSVFPPGIYVGKVSAINNSADGSSYTLTVRLSTDFSTLYDVSILSNPNKAELDALNKQADKEEAGL